MTFELRGPHSLEEEEEECFCMQRIGLSVLKRGLLVGDFILFNGR